MIKKLINSKLGQQIIKFGAVGFLCFFIEYVLLILFKELLGWPVIAANTLAFTVSAIVNYILSILFVFDTDKKANQGKQFAVFFIFAVGGLILNNVVLKLGTMVLDPFWSRSYIIVKPFATGVVMVYNFITRKIFIEKKPEKEPDPQRVDYTAAAQRDLTSRLGRGVRIVSGRKKGRIELEYYGMDDLNDLLEALALLRVHKSKEATSERT